MIFGIPPVIILTGALVTSCFWYQSIAVEVAGSKANAAIRQWEEDLNLGALQERIAEVRSQTEQAMGRIGELSQRFAAIRQSVADGQDLLEERQNEISEALVELAVRQKELDIAHEDLTQRSAELDRKFVALDEERAAIASRLDGLQRGVSEQRTEADRLRQQAAFVAEMVDASRRSTDDIQARLEDGRQAVIELQRSQLALRMLVMSVEEQVEQANLEKVEAVLKKVGEFEGASNLLSKINRYEDELAEVASCARSSEKFVEALRTGSQRLDQVRAGRVEVVTEQGSCVAILGVGEKHNGTLRLFSKDGMERAAIGATEAGGAGLTLAGSEGKPAVHLMAIEARGYLGLLNDNVPRLVLTAAPSSGFLSLMNEAGDERVGLGASTDGGGGIWLNDGGGSEAVRLACNKGSGQLLVSNKGTPVAVVGANEDGHGALIVSDRAGVDRVRVGTSVNMDGVVQLTNAKGESREIH